MLKLKLTFLLQSIRMQAIVVVVDLNSKARIGPFRHGRYTSVELLQCCQPCCTPLQGMYYLDFFITFLPNDDSTLSMTSICPTTLTGGKDENCLV